MLALLLLALLAGVGYLLPRAELQRQQTSAAVLNLIDRQYTLLERTALLAESLVTSSGRGEQARVREELRRELERMETSQVTLVQADPRLQVPADLNRQVREYLGNVRALLELPETNLTADHPVSQAIFAQATGRLAEDFEALAETYQQIDAMGIAHLRRMATGLLVAQLVALAALGWFVFRPLVTRVQREHEDRLRTERLAVIGSMAAKFAHEIRNPLGSIRLNLDSFSENPNGPQAPTLLRSIDSEVHRIHRISDGYLQFARLPKGARVSLSLNEWLMHHIQLCAGEFEQRGVRLVTQFANGLPAVSADDGQLWQAVLNLVRNAWEAMPDGGTLTVRTAHVRSYVRLEICDTGHGMSAEQRAAVFRPFVSAKKGGTGLGLALTQQIIIEHGGLITCASQPGKGTTFTLHLPVAEGTRK